MTTLTPIDRATRFVRIGLLVNAAVVLLAGTAMSLGLAPDSDGMWTRRSGVAHFAAAVAMVFASRRVRADPAIVWIPLAFVGLNLLDSILEVVLTRDPSKMGGLPLELLCTIMYATFLVTRPRVGT